MKKLFLFMAVSITATACMEQGVQEEFAGNWNGYGKYLKMGEQVHTLWAGKNINVGTVTYGLDDSANFYATYDCTGSGWKISETHMFAGDKVAMPLNKPGAPKIGLFPFSGMHSPRVSKFTYKVPLSQLPPAEEPGFVVAAHCIVHSPSGQKETAWSEGDYTFSDKGWGWYDMFYYNRAADTFTVLYGLTCARDSLMLYHLDITHGISELTFVEYVGNTAGNYDAAAYDPSSGLLFFVRTEDHELWANQMQDDDQSFLSGTLEGDVYSATFFNDIFYYVDDVTNTIHEVGFDINWALNSDIILDTIPGSLTVNDIAMDPDGEILYLLGVSVSGDTELLTWDTGSGDFYSTTVTIDDEAQIAFGSDGLLYAIAQLPGDGETTFVYCIDLESLTLTAIEDEIIILDDPFRDLASGPGI
jgi:hypothetical protein